MTPVFSHWFNLSIRRERRSFIFASLVLIVVFVTIFISVDLLPISTRAKSYILIIYAIATLIASYTLTAQRLRDMNVTGWLALLWIPTSSVQNELGSALTLTFIIILWTVPGIEGSNKYGTRLGLGD